MAMIDVIFGIVMTIGVLVLFYFTLEKGGGLANIISTLKAIEPKLVGSVGPPGIIPLLSLVFLILFVFWGGKDGSSGCFNRYARITDHSCSVYRFPQDQINMIVFGIIRHEL